MRVELFVKPGCTLCDDARDLLDAARKTWQFEVVERDIYASQALFDALRYAVPVVAIDGEERLRLRFGRAELERALGAPASPKGVCE